MANDPISKWANEAQRRAESALPKNSINTPLIPHEVYDQMEQIEKDIKRLVNEVLTGGKMENMEDATVKRILNNPVYIINGGHVGSGFFKGISLEQKPAYTLKKLKEIVQVR